MADFVRTYDRIVSGIENSGRSGDFDTAKDLWDTRPEEFIDRARKRGGESEVSGQEAETAFDFDHVEVEDVNDASEAFDESDDMDMDDTVDTVLEDELDAEMNDTAEKFKNVYKDVTQGYQTGKADFIAGAKAAYSKQTRRK